MAEKKKAPISTHSQASDKKKALETCIAQIEKTTARALSCALETIFR